MTPLNLSLYNLEHELLNLLRYREDIVNDAEMRPSERDASLAAIDMQIREYVGAEVRKVDGIAAALREFERRAQVDKDEAKRLKERADGWTQRHDRLESMVIDIMQQTEQRRLEGQHNTFALRKNPPAVEVSQPDLVPAEYKRVTVTLPASVWLKVKSALPVEIALLLVAVKEDTEPMKTEIREVLKAACVDCKGKGTMNFLEPDYIIKTESCPVCGGSGTKSVPGARMRPETNRLEVR